MRRSQKIYKQYVEMKSKGKNALEPLARQIFDEILDIFYEQMQKGELPKDVKLCVKNGKVFLDGKETKFKCENREMLENALQNLLKKERGFGFYGVSCLPNSSIYLRS